MSGSRILSPKAPTQLRGALAGLILTCTLLTARAQDWVQQSSVTDAGDIAAAGPELIAIAKRDGTLIGSTDAGQSFKPFRRDNVSRVSINADHAFCIVDTNGDVWFRAPHDPEWIQTNASGMTDVAIGPKGEAACTAAADGAVWISSDGRTFTKVQSSDFIHVSFDLQGTLWATGNNGSLWKFAGGKWEKTKGERLNDVAAGTRGGLWLTNTDGSVTVSFAGEAFTKPPGRDFENIAVTSKGVVWAVRKDGTLWSLTAPAPPVTGTPPPAPAPNPPTPTTPPPKAPPPAPKPTPQPQIVFKDVKHLYPDLEFSFRTNVPTIPAVYVSKRELDAYHPTNPATSKLIVGSKTDPLGTFHKIRVKLPKLDATYHILVFISYIDPKTNKTEFLPLWHDTVSVKVKPDTF
jgi:hypothetical protein